MGEKFEHHSAAKRGTVPLLNPNMFRSSGFIIGRFGLCLTAWHNAKNTLLTSLEGLFIDVIAHDEQLDVALIQLPRNSYHYLDLGDSSSLEFGEPVFHYGFGMNELMGFHGFFEANKDELLRSDAQMMHGQSGGPLLNRRGEVVGMNKGHLFCDPEKMEKQPSHTGPSVYIPSNNIRTFLEQHATWTNQGWVKNN